DLRDPGHRAVLRELGQRPRLLGDDGPDHPLRRDRDLRQPLRRHPLRLPRPEDAGAADLVAVNPQQEEFRVRAVVADTGAPGMSTAGAPVRQTSLWRDAWLRYRANKAAVIAAIFFIALVAYVIIVPFVSPYDPYAVVFSQAYAPVCATRAASFVSPPPSAPFSLKHPLGGDQSGRALFPRVALGGRVSIGIG